MFIHYIHVDILFPPTVVIPIMFERVTTYYHKNMDRPKRNAIP